VWKEGWKKVGYPTEYATKMTGSCSLYHKRSSESAEFDEGGDRPGSVHWIGNKNEGRSIEGSNG